MISSGTIALSSLTTLRLGGAAGRLVEARSERSLIEVVQTADSHHDPVLVIAGGSNLVVADAGFDGVVVRVCATGISRSLVSGEAVIEVQAGEPWDPFVAMCVHDGLRGLECLSGIPGSTGATPIQNVGAYGQEVSDTVVAVRAYDRQSKSITTLDESDCAFAYRSSRFKQEPERWLVLSVTYRLVRGRESNPVTYRELAQKLEIPVGASAPIEAVRDAVLHLRRQKGMVLDDNDPDTVSAGSFFTNPVLTADEFANLQKRIRDHCGTEALAPRFEQGGGAIKTSAAWLIEHAGFHRGYGNPHGIAISSKHTLALTNRGDGSTNELIRLAREIVDRVWQMFGVRLVPEPVFAGVSWHDYCSNS